MTALATVSVAAMPGTGVEKRVERPEKPDDELYNAMLKKAEKEHTEAKIKFDAARAKFADAQPKSKDSPAAKRRQELVAELNEIKQKRGAGRNQVYDQIRKLDEQLKSRIAEQKAARSRVVFKNVDEIDREIEYLEKQVNGGMMKLVDEKKALVEISSLRKNRKSFAGFEEAQKSIDELRAKIKALKDSLEDPEVKAMIERCNQIQAELDAIKAEQDEAYQNINTLKEQREKLYAEQQEKYLAVKKIKDDHFHAKKAYQNYEYEVRQRARERREAEREAMERERRRERAEKLLAEARDPAYLDEIRRAESLLHYLDPTTTTTIAPLVPPSGLSATVQRTVDASDIKGTRVVRKDEREDSYFMGTGGKKGKKNRKSAVDTPAYATASGKFNCPPSVMEDCSAMGIDPPMSQADIPSVTEKVKEKLAHWRADQKSQTEKNIAKAQKEIERLDIEATDSSPPTPTNGHAKKDTSKASQTCVNETEKVKGAVPDVVESPKTKSITNKE